MQDMNLVPNGGLVVMSARKRDFSFLNVHWGRTNNEGRSIKSSAASTDSHASTSPRCHPGPSPLPDLRHVFAMLGDVVFMLDTLVAEGLPGVVGLRTAQADAVDDISDEVKAV